MLAFRKKRCLVKAGQDDCILDNRQKKQDKMAALRIIDLSLVKYKMAPLLIKRAFIGGQNGCTLDKCCVSS